jgi:cell division protein FtsL
MIRVLNFLCVALMGLSILALYHVSEKTRVTEMQLERTNREISDSRSAIGVMQTEWERVAGPARIQQLAESRLGMSDTVSVQMSSFDQLPHRGQDAAPLNNTPLHDASAQVPAQAQGQAPVALSMTQISDRSGM